MEKNDTLDDMINRYGGYIEKKYNEISDELDEKSKKKLNRFIENYSNDDKLNQYKNDITLLLFNNKDLPKETRKLIEDKNN